MLLGLALLIALGFEFVNGFHDTANAVATVIYTHSLEPHVAVVYSGILNFIGVLLSSGTVAFAVISLLPVELILKVSKGAGFSMVFALLVAAILWNLATWYKGLPASSSHTMIGSIIGVGVANQLMQGNSGTAGVDWDAGEEGVQGAAGFAAGGLFCGGASVPAVQAGGTRSAAVQGAGGYGAAAVLDSAAADLTCGGVSFAHGSNDGQKGMGLIMLILVGTVPTAYALNHAVTPRRIDKFMAVSHADGGDAGQVCGKNAVMAGCGAGAGERSCSTKKYEPGVMLALRQMVVDIRNEVTLYGSLKGVPQEMQANVRNQMYLASETMRLMAKSGPKMSAADTKALTATRASWICRRSSFRRG